jgi:AcrR family transcriptional regulator
LADNKKPPRIRRSPEAAKTMILDFAEKIMSRGAGPGSLRLQDLAKEAGISHPTILHHFGSREGLMRALNIRAFERLTATAITQSPTESSRDGVATTFAAYRDGLAQRLVWLMQSGEELQNRPPLFEDAVKRFHELRKSFGAPGAEPDIADSRAVIHLVTVTAFGDALIGARLRHAGDGEPQARREFEQWLSRLLDMFLREKAGPR